LGGIITFWSPIDPESAAFVRRAEKLRQLRRVDAGNTFAALPVKNPGCIWLRSTLTGLPKVTPASLSLFPLLEQRELLATDLLRHFARVAPDELAPNFLLDDVLNGRGAAGLYSTTRPASGVLGAISKASVLRFAENRFGRKERLDELWIAQRKALHVGARRPPRRTTWLRG
jgi:hypothetical protein